MSSTRYVGSLLILSTLAFGCWADFPDSRFGADGGPPADLAGHEGGRDRGGELSPLPEAGRPDTIADGKPFDTAPTRDTASPADTQPVVDAVASDSSPCPAACSSCQNKLCQLACANGCTCPTGWDCAVTCPANGCHGPIDCSSGLSCTISCADSACTDTITCGLGFCSVTCDNKACTGDISCATSCGCEVECKTGTACTGTVFCPSICSGNCGVGDNCDNCIP